MSLLIFIKSIMLSYIFFGFLFYAYSVILKTQRNKFINLKTKRNIILLLFSLGIPPLFCFIEAFSNSLPISFIGVAYGYLFLLVTLNKQIRKNSLYYYLIILSTFSLIVNSVIGYYSLPGMLFFPFFNIMALSLIMLSFYKIKIYNYLLFMTVAFIVMNTNFWGIPLFLNLITEEIYIKSYIILVFLAGSGFFSVGLRNVYFLKKN